MLYELKVKAGVIDPDFKGIVLKNNSKEPIERVAGEQIAQLLFIKVVTSILIQIPSLTKTQHGEYGFGRTQCNLNFEFESNLKRDCKYCWTLFMTLCDYTLKIFKL